MNQENRAVYLEWIQYLDQHLDMGYVGSLRVKGHENFLPAAQAVEAHYKAKGYTVSGGSFSDVFLAKGKEPEPVKIVWVDVHISKLREYTRWTFKVGSYYVVNDQLWLCVSRKKMEEGRVFLTLKSGEEMWVDVLALEGEYSEVIPYHLRKWPAVEVKVPKEWQ